jgi:hypothetical protein
VAVTDKRRAALLLALGGLLLTGCGSSSSATSRHTASGAATSTVTSTASTSTTTSTATSPQANAPIGPEGIPLEQGPALASPASTAPGKPVDGIQCAPIEQLAYHIHAHLQVYLDGQPRALPPAIGLLGPIGQPTAYGPVYGASVCYYWLHTHESDGVIHIESPTQRLFTLGNFFDEWRQPLSSRQVATAGGMVTAFINGKRWTKSPRLLPLLPHAVIQLDVGAPVVPFSTISWAGTGL